jgi:hypothetical protein
MNTTHRLVSSLLRITLGVAIGFGLLILVAAVLI